MIKIILLDRDTLSADIPIPKPKQTHQWQEYGNSNSAQALQRLRGAQVAIVNKVPMHAELLKQLPELRLIAVAATGVNNVDLEACKSLNIAVCNVQAYAKHSVAEHVVALLLNLKRNIHAYHQQVQAGEWSQSSSFCMMNLAIEDLHGQTLGIIGQGAIGNHLAKIAKAFGMKVIFASRKDASTHANAKVPFVEFLQQADVISIHCPLNTDTQNLIAEKELSLMKNSAILINTARGGIVNEQALADALLDKKIAGAAFDVLSQEPPTKDNPLLKLSHLEQVIITPHNAWASKQAQQALLNQLMDNIDAYFAGKVQNRLV